MASPLKVISHSQKVCSLYKRSLRTLDAYYYDNRHFLYQMAFLRQRFDKNKNIVDMRKATVLLNAGEEELFQKKHYQPKIFCKSPGGTAYKREAEIPDWVLDFWHPEEKARYPHYFAVREQRKKEYVEFWNKTYGKPKDIDH